MAYKKHQQRGKGDRLRGEGDQTKFIDLRFEKWQVLGFGMEKEGKACSWDE